MMRSTVAVALLAALVVAATGCGGSKKSSDSTAATTPTTPTATATSSSSSGSSSSGSSSSSDSSGSDTSSSSGSSGSSDTIAKGCLDFAGAASKLGSALASGSSPTANSEELKNYFNGLASKAPSDIKSSFQTLAEAIGKYVDALKKANLKPGTTPSADTVAKLQNAIKSISTADVRAASAKIQAWVQAGCHG